MRLYFLHSRGFYSEFQDVEVVIFILVYIKKIIFSSLSHLIIIFVWTLINRYDVMFFVQIVSNIKFDTQIVFLTTT